MHTAAHRTSRTARLMTGSIGLALGLILVGLFAASASATKEVVAYFGTEAGTGSKGGEFHAPVAVGVNTRGAGPADKGDIYVADIGPGAGASRIQRFAQNDNGTPTNPYDDKYEFVSAWGADVDSTPSGGSDYEICTVAAECKFGVGGGGNGTPAGNGAFGLPRAIAVDQDTGDVYVVNASSVFNISVAVYSGNGTFLRSFGRDVVESGPGNTGTGYEVCVAANGDICKRGTFGSDPGELSSPEGIAISPFDGNSASGTVYVLDGGNRRVNTYALDGSAPSSFGSAAEFKQVRGIAVDSRGVVYVSDRNEGNNQIDRYDSQNANGGGVGFLAPIPAPPLLGKTGEIGDMEVDPDSDGPGPDTDVLYVLKGDGTNNSGVQQFGPVNAPGLIAPPLAADDFHGGLFGFKEVSEFVGLGLDDSNGKLFVSAHSLLDTGSAKAGVYVLDTAGGPPSASFDSISDITASTVTVHGTVEPNGPPPVDYRIEYSTDGSNWLSTPAVTIGSQEEPQAIEAVLNPPGGLTPDTFYHVRLVVTKQFNQPIVTAEKTFTTLTAAPQAETTGSPIRTATTARLEGRVNPRNTSSTFHFEYGSQGHCDSNPCTATDPVAAGSGDVLQFVSEQVEGLAPNTTYHYRVVADNGNPGSPSFGEDMTLTTRTSDAPLTHGDFPGPPGSDRAYEQVSLPNAGGNPVSGGAAIADDGESVHYQVFGGSPSSDTGSILNQYYAERTPSGWQNKNILPPRDQLVGAEWLPTAGRSDLSSLLIPNRNFTTGDIVFWRISPDAPPVKLYQGQVSQSLPFGASSGSSRAVARLQGGELDPGFPAAAAQPNLYDLSSGTPELVSIMPSGSPPACGVPDNDVFALPLNWLRDAQQWVSRDGSLVFFPSKGDSCGGPAQVYLRDLDQSSTELISGPTVSGTECSAAFIKSTPSAAFLWTQSRLAAEDTAPAGCGGSANGDVYRYDLGSGGLDCVTCVTPGVDADVFLNYSPGGASQTIAVAADGSRVYFTSSRRLLSGVPGGRNLYRVDVGSGDMRWIAEVSELGEYTANGNALTPDGSVLIFRSSGPGLNALGDGSDNGGTLQYYRYDDRDRSLICVSCPQDGSAPIQGVPQRLTENAFTADLGASPNLIPLSDDGDFFFATPTPLLGADQNTNPPDPILGTDVYEWRDGRLFLVSDGITTWPQENSVPKINGVGASGRDVFITVAAQYTQDALDAYFRMYDVRVGGGFVFPPKPKPCPLEVCQGTPKGAPEEAAPGTGAFSGPGNAKGPTTARKSCPKGKRKVRRGGRARCVTPKPKQHKRQRANHDRRNGR